MLSKLDARKTEALTQKPLQPRAEFCSVRSKRVIRSLSRPQIPLGVRCKQFCAKYSPAVLPIMSVPMKLESIPDHHVKMEPPADTPSPYMDDIDDAMEEAGDLDFSHAQQQFWLGHLPRSLWEALSKVGDDAEIELGTIRVEGPEADPKRVGITRLDRKNLAD